MKKDIVQIVVAAVLLTAAMVVDHVGQAPLWVLTIIYAIPYLVVGAEVVGESIEKAVHGELFSEDLLMSIATVGAFGISYMPEGSNEMPEAVFVMLFFRIGECFEEYAQDRSRDSISHLMEMKPEVAHIVRGGVQEDVSPEELCVGDVVVVQPGERVPTDGTVVAGTSALNTVALTGESEPRGITVGSQALSGCINTTGVVSVRVDKVYADSTVAKVMRLVEDADAHKSRSESFIARFSHVYTPIVVGLALIVAFVPPLFSSAGYVATLATWVTRALTFLIISCPCALVISVPLTFFAGIGGASRRGILIKGSSFIDSLANLHTVVFDKTGTLTQGSFKVTLICPTSLTETELLHIAAQVERHSTHPIATALAEACHTPLSTDNISDQRELPGLGLTATIDGNTIAVGNDKLMSHLGIPTNDHSHHGTIVHVAINNTYAGHIVVSDTLKPDAPDTIAQLKQLGIDHTVMLTGDRHQVADDIAHTLNIDEWHANLMPADKLAHLERLLRNMPHRRTLAFVGDGINDTPVLTRADVGIAMGAMGSDAAIEAADVVLMDDAPSKITQAIRIARRILSIARQNVIFAIGIKVAVLILAVIGIAGMGLAVFADVGVTVLAVLNAMRALRA